MRYHKTSLSEQLHGSRVFWSAASAARRRSMRCTTSNAPVPNSNDENPSGYQPSSVVQCFTHPCGALRPFRRRFPRAPSTSASSFQAWNPQCCRGRNQTTSGYEPVNANTQERACGSCTPPLGSFSRAPPSSYNAWNPQCSRGRNQTTSGYEPVNANTQERACGSCIMAPPLGS
jgi:hypothetical protein